MFGFKKVAGIVAVTLASLAVPSLALADDHDGRWGRDDSSIAQLRVDIQRDRLELARDQRDHRWADARREQREIDAREAQLREMLRHRGR